ncbi:MAG: DUF362 domain-containing protein, partial [Candidatus Electrothrix sp. EH2]|nr:DUF362 domain-containing protein [Candidatus Electrothrix sp. EH2]
MKSNRHKGIVYTGSFLSWEKSLPPLLDKAALTHHIPAHKTILIKPNSVEILGPPITTPVALVKCLIKYFQENLTNPIVTAEGCGALAYNTHRCFAELGYTETARETGADLIDLNEEPCQRHTLPQCRRWS